MYCPLRAIIDRDSFYQHIPAVHRLDKRGSQCGLFRTKNPVLYSYPISFGITQLIRRCLLQLLPVPPGFTVSVQLAFSGNGYILAAQGINQRRVIVALHPFPPCKDRRKVMGRVVAEMDNCPLLKIQMYITS
ncbi:hypothetical protein D3C73_1200750 [compost metagenome]